MERDDACHATGKSDGNTMKQVLGLIVGLLVGVAGAVMFSKSVGPEEGSAEALLEVTEYELRRVTRQVREYETKFGQNRGGRTVQDGVRGIVQDIKEGRQVSMDDVYKTMQPWLQDMSPLFGRMRELNEEEWADSMTGEWAREYDLNASEREQLKRWFQERSRERGEELQRVIASDDSGFVDFIKVTEYDWRDAQGADEVMEGFLEGEELQAFQAERLQERLDSVQGAANGNLNRLNVIVDLDEGQQDEVFGILARGSDDYEAGMDFDGMGGDTSQLDRRARDEAIRSVLRPEQVERFDTHQAGRRADAEKDLRKMGLSLPDDWDLLEGDSF